MLCCEMDLYERQGGLHCVDFVDKPFCCKLATEPQQRNSAKDTLLSGSHVNEMYDTLFASKCFRLGSALHSQLRDCFAIRLGGQKRDIMGQAR